MIRIFDYSKLPPSTVEAALAMLLKEGFIAKEGAGKRTSYVKT